jgi:hypothetical protein
MSVELGQFSPAGTWLIMHVFMADHAHLTYHDARDE